MTELLETIYGKHRLAAQWDYCGYWEFPDLRFGGCFSGTTKVESRCKHLRAHVR